MRTHIIELCNVDSARRAVAGAPQWRLWDPQTLTRLPVPSQRVCGVPPPSRFPERSPVSTETIPPPRSRLRREAPVLPSRWLRLHGLQAACERGRAAVPVPRLSSDLCASPTAEGLYFCFLCVELILHFPNVLADLFLFV